MRRGPGLGSFCGRAAARGRGTRAEPVRRARGVDDGECSTACLFSAGNFTPGSFLHGPFVSTP